MTFMRGAEHVASEDAAAKIGSGSEDRRQHATRPIRLSHRTFASTFYSGRNRNRSSKIVCDRDLHGSPQPSPSLVDLLGSLPWAGRGRSRGAGRMLIFKLNGADLARGASRLAIMRSNAASDTRSKAVIDLFVAVSAERVTLHAHPAVRYPLDRPHGLSTLQHV